MYNSFIFLLGCFLKYRSFQGISTIFWNTTVRMIYLFNHLFIRLDSWIFILFLGFQSNLSCFVAQIVPGLAIMSSFLLTLFQVFQVELAFLLFFFFFLALLYFLTLQDVSGSLCIFPVSALESSPFSKEPWFLFL